MLPTEYNDDLVQDFEIETQPTRTYALRFDGYPCSGGKLDGLEAMKHMLERKAARRADASLPVTDRGSAG